MVSFHTSLAPPTSTPGRSRHTSHRWGRAGRYAPSPRTHHASGRRVLLPGPRRPDRPPSSLRSGDGARPGRRVARRAVPGGPGHLRGPARAGDRHRRRRRTGCNISSSTAWWPSRATPRPGRGWRSSPPPPTSRWRPGCGSSDSCAAAGRPAGWRQRTIYVPTDMNTAAWSWARLSHQLRTGQPAQRLRRGPRRSGGAHPPRPDPARRHAPRRPARSCADRSSRPNRRCAHLFADLGSLVGASVLSPPHLT